MVRYRRVRLKRVQRLHPFPADGVPVASWRELQDGSVECTTPAGRKHIYAPNRITWTLR
jgi:hypothetical protein